MPDFLRKMRNLFNGSQDEAATSQQDAPAEDMAEEDVDVMTELFGAYVNPPSDTAGTGAETDSVQEADDSHAENEKVYDNYDTDAIAADEIAAPLFLTRFLKKIWPPMHQKICLKLTPTRPNIWIWMSLPLLRDSVRCRRRMAG